MNANIPDRQTVLLYVTTMASAPPDSLDPDVNANTARARGTGRTEDGDPGDYAELISDEEGDDAEEEIPPRGTTEELLETIKKRFEFLYPRFFALTKITKSTSAKKRSDIGLQFTCRNCPNSKLSAGVSSISNLRRHIKSQHPSLFDEYERAWKKHKQLRKRPNTQKDTSESEAKKKKEDAEEKKTPTSHQSTLFSGEQSQDQIDRRVIRFVVDTNQGFNSLPKILA